MILRILYKSYFLNEDCKFYKKLKIISIIYSERKGKLEIDYGDENKADILNNFKNFKNWLIK